MPSACDALSVPDNANKNLTAPQKELLLWHQQFGHVGFGWLQWMVVPSAEGDDPCIIAKHKTTHSTKAPPCAACLFARQKQQGDGVHKVSFGDEEMIRGEDLQPGDCVSMDNCESSIKERREPGRGRDKHFAKCCGGTMF